MRDIDQFNLNYANYLIVFLYCLYFILKAHTPIIAIESKKQVNYYGIEDIVDETNRTHSEPLKISPEAKANKQYEPVPLGSFKSRPIDRASKLSTNSNDDTNGLLVVADDLKPVFYELDELEKRLSESLSELVKMRGLNGGIAESVSNDLTSSLIGTTITEPSQDFTLPDNKKT